MKKPVSIIAAAVLAVSAAPVFSSAADTAQDDIAVEYTVRNKEVCITGCNGSVASLVIPSQIEGFPVTSVAESAFEGNDDIISCTFPDSLKKIGAKAFRACPQLSDIKIGSGVSDIGEYAFTACPALTKIDIDTKNNIYSNINGCLFKNGDTLLIYAGSKDAVIPDDTKFIGKGAFFGRSDITSITIPKNVEFIDDHAFSGCLSLKNIDIPDNVKNLGAGCFMSCTSLQSATLGNGLDSVPENCFHSCSALEKVVFSESVSAVWDDAFYSCPALSGIYLPPTVKIIGSNAIGKRYDIRSDSSVNIPNFIIKGEKDSAAEKYAKEQEFPFMTGYITKGDVNGDNCIDSVDASAALKEYSLASSGKESILTDDQKKAADWNGDNKIDSVDSSAIMAEYARVQTL